MVIKFLNGRGKQTVIASFGYGGTLMMIQAIERAITLAIWSAFVAHYLGDIWNFVV